MYLLNLFNFANCEGTNTHLKKAKNIKKIQVLKYLLKMLKLPILPVKLRQNIAGLNSKSQFKSLPESFTDYNI